jgi:hypothetical protein
MSRTTISRDDIRDGAINGDKLSNPISVQQLVTEKIVHGDGGMTTVYDHTTTNPGVLHSGSLLVSTNSADKASIPEPNGSAYFAGDVVILGNMTTLGVSTVINTEQLKVNDNIIVLNSNVQTTNTVNAGIEVNRGSSMNKVGIQWNESTDVWELSNGGAFGRIVDQVYGDERYMARTNSSFTGEIITTSTVDDIVQLRQSGGGASYLSFYSNKVDPASYVKVASVGVNTGETDLILTAPSRIYLSNDTYLNGNLSIKEGSTVDGVDISAHHGNLISNVKHVTDAYLGALAGTNGTPSSSNKYVTNTDTRLSNARTPVTHGDAHHNNLSYFNTISDDQAPQNIKSATTTLRNMQIKGGTNIQVNVSSDSSYAGIVTISGVHHHDSLYMKLSSTGTQNIASDLVIGSVESPKSLTVQGDLTVSGTTTYLNTTQLNVGDNIITLNNDYAGSTPTENAGIEVNRGTLAKASLLWDEANDYWVLTNDGTTYNRVVDLNLADSRYVNVTGDSMTGTLETTISSGSGLKVSTGNNDINIWELNYTSGGYGFDLKYTGVGSGNDNALELWADNQTGAAQRAYRVRQDGTMTIDQALTISSAVSMASGAAVTGNISVTGTVDGRDVSADGAKLDPMYSIYQKRGRQAAAVSVAIPQDVEVSMSTIGIGLTWISSSIVMVIVDGQVNAPGIDYTLGVSSTITFHYDIPADSIIDVIVI